MTTTRDQQNEPAESCARCGLAPIDSGAQLYFCDRCGDDVCSACSKNVGRYGVVCVSHDDDDAAGKMIADLRAEVADADRNARFVEKVREIVNSGRAPYHIWKSVEQALAEIDDAPCKPVEPVKE